MPRGDRPPAEFVDGRKRRVTQAALPSRMTPTWPELRIIRQPDLSPREGATDWDEFQNDVGRCNYGKGYARSLGSVALVYIKACEMGRMMDEKYAHANLSRDRTKDTYRKMAQAVREFVRERFGQAYNTQTSDLEFERKRLQYALQDYSCSNELVLRSGNGYSSTEYSKYKPARSQPSPPHVLDTIGDTVRMPQTEYFGNAVLEVKALTLFGKDGYGLDLSPNEQLYDERAELVRFLRLDAGLNTRGLNNIWTPHATLFNFEQHIQAAPLSYRTERPLLMAFEPPRPHVT